MCKITVGSTTTASVQILVVLWNVSSLTALTGLVAVVSILFIILADTIVLTCAMGRCSILHLNSLHHRFHLLQLCGQL